MTNLIYWIDADGNMSGAMSGTSDPDGKIAKENAERKARESREKEKKVKEKRAAKRAEEKRLQKKRAAKKAFAEQTQANVDAGGEKVKTSEKTFVYMDQAMNSGSNFNCYR
ncbi:hypothetical protein LQZ18_09725 [Lachnospiraceae bacterium ZAX-1]